jgi:hypothetical protein
MRDGGLDDLFDFLIKYSRENYFREVDKWQLSVFQQKLKGYGFEEIKRAFERHLTNPKKGEFFPTPQNIIAEIGYREKQKNTMELACNFTINGYPCGQKAVISYEGKDKRFVALCEPHYDSIRPVGDIELEMLRRAQEMRQQAKVAGITNREYAEATGFTKTFEQFREASEKKARGKAPLADLVGWASAGKRHQTQE